jgi:predicted MPP superfamily phosphohydrolase
MNKHQETIRKSANKNPLKAYFLGGFELADKEKQEEVKEFLDKHAKEFYHYVLVDDLTEEQNKE